MSWIVVPVNYDGQIYLALQKQLPPFNPPRHISKPTTDGVVEWHMMPEEEIINDDASRSVVIIDM